MKALRVLAGVHAGAGLSLPPGRYRVASTQAEAFTGSGDIPVTLIDWSVPPLLLVSAEAGPLWVEQGGEEAGQVGDPQVWHDFQVRRFGDVILCAGEADATWPSDEELLARPEAQPGGGGPPRLAVRKVSLLRSWSMRAGIIGAGLLAAVGALYGGSATELRRPQALRPDYGAELLARSLADQGLRELKVHAQHDDIRLAGLVRNAAEAQTLRATVADIERRTGVPVVAQWEVADDVASTIEAALRQSGVHARYIGAGRFLVEGVVADPAATGAAGGPLAKDLGGNVSGIDFALERRASKTLFSAAVSADSLRYTERADGAKVFSRKEQPL